MSRSIGCGPMVGRLRVWPCCEFCCDLPPHGKGGRRIKRREKRRERQGWKSEVRNLRL